MHDRIYLKNLYQYNNQDLGIPTVSLHQNQNNNKENCFLHYNDVQYMFCMFEKYNSHNPCLLKIKKYFKYSLVMLHSFDSVLSEKQFSLYPVEQVEPSLVQQCLTPIILLLQKFCLQFLQSTSVHFPHPCSAKK